jgi:hypothetical protein
MSSFCTRFLLLAMLALVALVPWASAPVRAQTYPCVVMVLDSTDQTVVNKVFTFDTQAGVDQFFGSSDVMGKIAGEWWPDGYGSCGGGSAVHMKVVRFPVEAARAHLLGGNLDTTYNLISTYGTFQVTSQGQHWLPSVSSSSPIAYPSGDSEGAAMKYYGGQLTSTINGTADGNLPVLAQFTASLDETTCAFKGYLQYGNLNVTDWNSSGIGCRTNGIPPGAQICDVGATFSYDATLNVESCTGGKITSGQQNMINSVAYENNNTTQNPAETANVGTYTMFLRQKSPQMTSPIAIQAYWMQLSVSSVSSGTIAVGQQLQVSGSGGAAFAGNECVIWANLTGSGSSGASTWLVSCLDPTNDYEQTNASMSSTPCDMEAIGTILVPASPGPGHAYLEINNYCPFSSTSIGYLTDTCSGCSGAGGVSDTFKLSDSYSGWSAANAFASFADSPGRLSLT